MPDPASNAIDWPLMLETHKSWLTKVLRCRMGDAHAVDDALQEIALAVIRQSTSEQSDVPERHGATTSCVVTAEPKTESQKTKTPPIPVDPDKVAPWLYRVAVRQAVNFHRKLNRKSNATPVSDLEQVSSARQPLDWLLEKEERKRFNEALNRLTPAQREMLTLKYAEKWSYQQLADHLGIPVRSVEYRLLQARTELRKLL